MASVESGKAMIPEQPAPPSLGDWLALWEQMRATELLLEDVQIDPANLTAYWAISADLLALLQDTEEYLDTRCEHGPGPDADEAARHLATRRRLVAILAKATEIDVTVESDQWLVVSNE